LNQQICRRGEFLRPQQPKHNPVGIDADRGVPAGCSDKVAYVTESIRERADGNVLSRCFAGAWVPSVSAFGRQSGGHPVKLSGAVLVHVAKPQAVEPRRGSWSQVSTGVPAVDDHDLAGVEGARVLFQSPQRKADRTWKVILGVLLGWKYFDEPCSFTHQLLNLLAIDSRRHDGPTWIPSSDLGRSPAARARPSR
jgi:hypothetical protein